MEFEYGVKKMLIRSSQLEGSIIVKYYSKAMKYLAGLPGSYLG